MIPPATEAASCSSSRCIFRVRDRFPSRCNSARAQWFGQTSRRPQPCVLSAAKGRGKQVLFTLGGGHNSQPRGQSRLGHSHMSRVQRRRITYSFHTGGSGVETGTLQVTTEGTIPTGLSPSHWGHETHHGRLIVGSFLSVK
jgi:hypothetical protein